MDNDYKKRSFLLPDGCKDLIDLLKPKALPKPIVPPTPAAALPPIVGEITVAERMTVPQLAALLKQKPFRIIEDLMDLRVFASMDQPVSFATAAQVVRKYGYKAKKAA